MFFKLFFQTSHAKSTVIWSGRGAQHHCGPGLLAGLDHSNIILVWVSWLARPKKYYFGLGCPSGLPEIILLWSWLVGWPDQSNISLVWAGQLARPK